MMNPSEFLNLRFSLNNYKRLSVTGNDSQSFLHGQLTSDVKDLKSQQFHWSARITRAGRLLTHLILLKNTNSEFEIIAPSERIKELEDDLNKYVIMEDVNFKQLEGFYIYSLDPTHISEASYLGRLTSHFGILNLAEEIIQLENNLRCYLNFSAFPVWGKDFNENTLLNETVLNEWGTSYKKGCFLGQETVAKIETRRGAAFYPSILECDDEIELSTDQLNCEGKKIGKIVTIFNWNNKSYIKTLVLREFRIDRSQLFVDELQGYVTVHLLPFIALETLEAAKLRFFTEATKLYHRDEFTRAKQVLFKMTKFWPDFADSFELLGVILGQEKNFELAICSMDDLLKIDPDSVMAHTNKSLFLMNLGKIDEAEKEKDLAVLASFKKASLEKKSKEVLEKERERKKQENESRRKMFEQVLEIDPVDTIANYGLADIFYAEEKFDQAVQYLKIVLSEDEKYSIAYLLLGKCYIGLNNEIEAIEILVKGIEVAKNKGELQPANQMAALLVELRGGLVKGKML